MRSFLYRFLIRKRLASAERVAELLQPNTSRTDIESYQVKKFNDVWRVAVENVPFYRKWAERYNLPRRIENLSDLDSWPILSKSDIRDLRDFERTDVPRPSGRILTGGSTGEPVRLPSWGDSLSGTSQIIGRRSYGVEPGDKTFLLWGHEHLYGKGFLRRVNTLKRRLKDWLAGWVRVSAYDLSQEAMIRAYNVFAQSRPSFVIGFSPAVLSFVRQNRQHAGEVKSVRVVLCTAGPLSKEEKDEIESFFGGRVCMEYGSVECGIMAYTRPSDDCYKVFWHTHILQAIRQPDGEYKNIVTRLTDCYVPLIRYDIGDYLELGESKNCQSVLHFKYVKGRPSEMLHFACGVSFFGALIGDCVKQVPEVVSSQIAVKEENDFLEIRVTASVPLPRNSLDLIANRFALTVSDAANLTVRVVQVAELFTTVGGKTPRVVKL